MNVNFLPEAEEALFEIGSWIESRNTSESGIRFINKFVDKVSAYALPNIKYLVCRNEELAALQLRCVAIDNWVVAFKQTKEEFVVHYILYGLGLK